MSIQLGLFDTKFVAEAKKRKVADWPDPLRLPVNFDRRKVEDVVCEDIKKSSQTLIVTGFTSLDYLIDFVVDISQNGPEKISILLGSEPTPARRTSYCFNEQSFPQEVTDYWLEQGISLRLCHKIILFIEMLESGRVVTRYISDPSNKLHAKIYITDFSACMGSSNFSFMGFRRQLEGNVRFDLHKREHKRYREVKQVADNYWSLGEEYNQDLIALLRKLLQVSTWEEALGRACGELLEGDWAKEHLKNVNVYSGNELWPSQKAGISQALWMIDNVGSVLIADATGSGKTRMGVHLLHSVMNGIYSKGRARKDLTVLVCPPNVVEESWKKEAGECGLPLETISHGMLSNRKSEKYNEVQSLVRRAQSLGVDEAHNFLNPQSSRTRGVFENMADVMVMFTATPINKGVGDLLRLVDLLGADNLEPSALKLFERLQSRARNSGSQFITTREERLAMQEEVHRFTIRRTKSMLNAMVDQQPDAYRDDRGSLCRYPEHNSKTYQTAESENDKRLAEEIRDLAGKLLGLVNLRSGVDMPDSLRETLDPKRFIQGRLQGARGLAIYNVMSRLRSSRAALIEHLLGTVEASKRFGIDAKKIKAESTGNVLAALHDSAGVIHESSLEDLLPEWLINTEMHKQKVHDELEIYHEILSLVGEMSDEREKAKAEHLVELSTSHSLLIAFDSCLITLEVIRNFIKDHNNDSKVLIATGAKVGSKKTLNKEFSWDSSAENKIALCSDAMSEGLNLQKASSVVLLDMPSVIRLAEQRVGRVDRMNSPHKEIEVWWPLDSEEFSLKTDRKFFQRYRDVRDILGSNLDLPDDLIPEGLGQGPETAEEMIKKLEELDQRGTSWDGIQDAFQPVRDLVDPQRGIVPEDVYATVRKSKARVLSSISLLKSKSPWAFFAISGSSRKAPKWILLKNPSSKPDTRLEKIAPILRHHLSPEVEEYKMDKYASHLIGEFLDQILRRERELLPRKKQRALEEMDHILGKYKEKAQEQGCGERIAFINQLLNLTTAPRSDAERPDLDSVAEAWLDATRETWYKKLVKRKARYKPLRLKNIRSDLIREPLSTGKLQTAFQGVQMAQPLYSRVVSAIVGVPSYQKD